MIDYPPVLESGGLFFYQKMKANSFTYLTENDRL